MAVRAGRMDRRITIQALTEAQDTTGAPIQTWADLYTDIAASFSPVSATEQFKTGQRMADEAGTFRVRWRADWTPSPKTHRISYHSKTWDITGVVEVGRREAWDLMAEVRGTSGGG